MEENKEVQGVHKGMVGLKASTEVNPVRGKVENMFYFTREIQECHVGCVTTRHTVNSVQRRQRQTPRHCDRERASGGDTWCVEKNIYLRDGIQCCDFHCLTFR